MKNKKNVLVIGGVAQFRAARFGAAATAADTFGADLSRAES